MRQLTHVLLNRVRGLLPRALAHPFFDWALLSCASHEKRLSRRQVMHISTCRPIALSRLEVRYIAARQSSLPLCLYPRTAVRCVLRGSGIS